MPSHFRDQTWILPFTQYKASSRVRYISLTKNPYHFSTRSKMDAVTVQITGGPTTSVAWTQGLNVQQAMELAYVAINNSQQFTYALQYYGSFGYLVMMINETYDSFSSSSAPYWYWELLVNGQPSSLGIDNEILNAGDEVTFQFSQYSPDSHPKSALQVKFDNQIKTV